MPASSLPQFAHCTATLWRPSRAACLFIDGRFDLPVVLLRDGACLSAFSVVNALSICGERVSSRFEIDMSRLRLALNSTSRAALRLKSALSARSASPTPDALVALVAVPAAAPGPGEERGLGDERYSEDGVIAVPDPLRDGVAVGVVTEADGCVR